MFGFARAKRVTELEERLEKLERELRNAVADVSDAYERTLRLHGRIVKRAKVDMPDVPEPAAVHPESATRSSIDLARSLARSGRPVHLMAVRKREGES